MLRDLFLLVLICVAASVYWGDPRKRRDFLANFARQEGFDPLDGEAWSKTSEEHFRSQLVI